MEHKVLVGIDCSPNAERAVDYVGNLMRVHPRCRITLHHVLTVPSADVLPDPDRRRQTLEERRQRALRQLDAMAGRLVERGIPRQHIRLQVQECEKGEGIARRLLEEQRRGGYHTVVVGRRGMSKREEFLFGSVSSKIIREAKNCTVWVVQ
ncbi:Nucleotide-binding universal stress protein, UspA family [Desulfacinum hydrothermale DSM 13146]|uniref:Nucleotide-binding universal stress protein, UspA family n=1 Tax=Desulfacinum hydrothermale DSM 13146 TaxID=1121390 RepID=A0A1W1X2S0_9BACT|nr:universal stress protein [Desulfacinum hydrothermale]SMC18269.1 Nucleotide-binding universal stress protein, UspA family [Desulfacinum hydrothermale DSM 13146]